MQIKIEKELEEKLKAFAEQNKTTPDELLNTILYEYFDTVKYEPTGEELYEMEEYSPEDIEYVSRMLGF